MATSVSHLQLGWLCTPQFDLTFVVGTAVLALGSGVLVVSDPGLFPFVLFLDLWLLGYHHVFSTYSRIAFDAKSFEDNKFLILVLPVIVAVAVALALLMLGTWTLVSVYLYWQWWHYTRQSYGISRIYARKAGADPSKDHLTTVLIYAVPLWGILYRSYQAPPAFLYLPLKTIPIPYFVVVAAGAFCGVVFVVWALQKVREFLAGQFAPLVTLYLLSHVAIFSVGYVLTSEINHGWLVLNIWHNAQYILLVWFYNNNKFKQGVDAQQWFISTLSQRKNVVYYFALFLGVSTLFYYLLSNFLEAISTTIAIPAAVTILTVYQIINFHHYIVDSKIWKVRKPVLKQNLGLQASE
jgi:hypothetical protein